MPNLTGRKRNRTNQNRPAKYNTKKAEPRGKTNKEPKVVQSFWKDYTMDNLMTKSDIDLDILVDDFLQKYEAKQIAVNKSWWYPEVMITPLKKTKSKYKAEPFN